jgi:hypothetical protein
MTLQLETTPHTPSAARPGPAVTRPTAIFLCVSFLLCIAIPPVHQLIHELRQSGNWRFLSLFRQAPTHDSLRAFEDSLARDSVLAARARVAYQAMLARALGEGSDNILIGRDGFLFYRAEVDMACGPGFLQPRPGSRRVNSFGFRIERTSDPIGAIADFSAGLRERGIQLVFVPIPSKPVIYPERAWAGYPASAGPAWNLDFEKFRKRLATAGVDVLDLTGDLWAAKRFKPDALYLKQDTHWSPSGLSVAAERIAAHVRDRLPEGSREYTPVAARISSGGDLLRMLDIGDGNRLLPEQEITITQVYEGERTPRGDDASPLLLMGDSYTNIYSRANLGWGEGAGLGEQLTLRLHQPVQVIAVDGGGATIVRERLARLPQALARKKMVIWACSSRDLFDDQVSWDRVPLPNDASRK